MPDINNNLIGNEALKVLDKEEISTMTVTRLLDTLVFYKYGSKPTLVDNNGRNVTWKGFRPLDLTKALEPLSEGVSPEASKLEAFEIYDTLEQYGAFMPFSDIVLKHGNVKTLTKEAVTLLHEYFDKVFDGVIANRLIAQTFKVFGAGQATITTEIKTGGDVAKGKYEIEVTNGATGGLKATSYITEEDLEDMFVWLKSRGVKPNDDGFYTLIADTFVESDIRRLQTFTDKSKYQDPSGKGFEKNEIGKIKGFRVESTTKMPTTTIGGIVYRNVLAFGKDAFGISEVEGQNGAPETIIKPLGSGGTSDALNQKATVGGKAMFNARVIADPSTTIADDTTSKIARLICATRRK